MTALRPDHVPAGWELLKPLPLHIGQNQAGQIVVSEEIFDTFGVGATEE